MRPSLALTAAVLLNSLSLTALAQHHPPPPPQNPSQYQWGRSKPPKAGACFYRDVNFTGDYFCLKTGETWGSMPHGFNDKITAIRVFNGVQVRIFQDDSFRGDNIRISRDVNDLSHIRLQSNPSKNWNDRVSSIAVYRANDSWDRGHP